MPSLRNLPWNHPLAASVVPLVAVRGTESYASGTAFFVADTLAVTAAHVLNDFAKRLGAQEPRPGRDVTLDFQLHALRMFDGVLYDYQVRRAWFTSPADLAVVEILPSGPTPLDKWPRIPIEPVPPSLDEETLAVGHRRQSAKVALNTGHLTTSFCVAPGEVKEVHVESRDRACLPFPCFRTDAQYDGGMSGGPVYNSAGRICGVVCSSIPAQHDAEEHVSYAASIWPLFGVLVDPPEGGSPIRLLEMAKAGHLDVSNLDRLSLRSPSAGEVIVDLADERGRILDSLS